MTADTFYGPDQIQYLQTVLGEATAAGGSNLQVRIAELTCLQRFQTPTPHRDATHTHTPHPQPCATPQVSILGITEVFDVSPSPAPASPLEPSLRRLAGCSGGDVSRRPPSCIAAVAAEQGEREAVGRPNEELRLRSGRDLQQGGQGTVPAGVNVDTVVVFPGDQSQAAQRFANLLRTGDAWLASVYGPGAAVSGVQVDSEK